MLSTVVVALHGPSRGSIRAMSAFYPKQVNSLLVTFRGEIITVRQALAGGIVKPYLDSGTDDIVFLEIDPSRIVQSPMRVLLSKI
jgi:hypothetical protein